MYAPYADLEIQLLEIRFTSTDPNHGELVSLKSHLDWCDNAHPLAGAPATCYNSS